MNNRTLTTILVLLSLATMGAQQTFASNRSGDDDRQVKQERADERAERLLKSHIRHFEDDYFDVDPAKYGFDSYVEMANAYRNNPGQESLTYYLYCLGAQEGEKEAYYYIGKFYNRNYLSEDGLWRHDTEMAQAFFRRGAELGCSRSKDELLAE